MESLFRYYTIWMPVIAASIIILIIMLPKYNSFVTTAYLQQLLDLQATKEMKLTQNVTTKGFTYNATLVYGIKESIVMSYFAFPIRSVKSSEAPPFVIYVKSAAANSERRDIIRSTWGLQAYSLKVPVVFVVGTETQHNNEKLENEIEKHGDLLWINFKDTYVNLSFKTLAIVLFHQRLHANWTVPVFVTDDDVIVFVKNLAQLVQNMGASKSEDAIVGSCWDDATPIRNPEHKNYVSRKTYPDRYYPGYCSGTGYLFGRGVIKVIFNNLLPMEWYAKSISEDVLFTGIIRQNAGLKFFSNSKFSWDPAGNCDVNDLAITRHGFSSPQALHDAWKKCAP